LVFRETRSGGGGGRVGLGGFGGPPPSRDLVALLIALFVTFSLQFFAATGTLLQYLRLTPLVWQRGYVWQLATYPFIGFGRPGIGFLLELLMIFWFGRDVFAGLGRRHFWKLIGWGAGTAALVAVAVDALAPAPPGAAFYLMQGQRVLIAIFIAAFATANRRATILLFFILPIEARWFLWIELLIAFMGFLATHDLAGFLGICTAIGLSFLYIRDGGIGRGLRQTRLRFERWWLQQKLDRLKRKRGMRVVRGERGDFGRPN
jgi:hypothetical protein